MKLWMLLLLSGLTVALVGASCDLRFTLPQDMCECDGKNVTCVEHWPEKDQIPQEVVSLTITGCNKRKLGDSKNEFGKLKDLVKLNLTNNSINVFSSAASFHHRDLPNIMEIILDINNLTLTRYQVFNGLQNLEMLSLKQAFNNSKKSIGNLTKTFSRSTFSSLREVRLDNNDFTLLGTGMFTFDGGKGSIVETISLRNCSLVTIQGQTFMKKYNPQLKFIDLSMNEITMLNDGEGLLKDFDNYGSQLTINLTGNHFHCNCYLEQFRTWLNTTSVKIVDKDALACATSENKNLTGRPIISLTNELSCINDLNKLNVDNQMKLPYIILSVIFGIIGILFVIVMYMRRSEIQTWFFTTGIAIKEIFCSGRTGYSDIGRVQRSEVPADMPPAEVW